jgi:hypothetical protein
MRCSLTDIFFYVFKHSFLEQMKNGTLELINLAYPNLLGNKRLGCCCYCRIDKFGVGVLAFLLR